MEAIFKSNQQTKTSLFFIALIPDSELRMKINKIKRDFKTFESTEATKVYPHITLKAPFTCSGNDREKILRWFSAMRLQQERFHLYLHGFGSFYNKYNPVVFVNPLKNDELLKMQRELMIGFNNILPARVHRVDRKFKPHMTVAYRDLTPENFSRAWQKYKDKPFYDVFDVHTIYLLKYDWKKWNIIGKRKLG